MEFTKHGEEVAKISNNGAINTQLNTFTHFSSLPQEVRIKIWRYSAHVPRNIDLLIKKRKFKAETALEAPSIPKYQIVSRSPYPALLLVCQESRNLGLKFYKLEFGTYDYQSSIPNANVIVVDSPRVYVNWSVDRLCLINAAASSFYHKAATVVLDRAAIMKAKSIAVNIHPRLGHDIGFNRLQLAKYAIKADADEIIVVCQAPMSNRHAVRDEAGRTNWEFQDFNATDSQNQQHSVMTRFVTAFQVLVRMEGLSWEKFQGFKMGKMLKETAVHTRIRTCNECPQMVFAAAASRKSISNS